MTAQYLMEEEEIKAFNHSQSAKIINIRQKRLEKEKAKKLAFESFKNALFSIALVLFVAGLFSLYIYKNSLVNEAKYEIYNLKETIKSANAEREELTAKIESQTELKNIEKLAVETLGMQYPVSGQIVYVTPKYEFALSGDSGKTAISVQAVNTVVSANGESESENGND